MSLLKPKQIEKFLLASIRISASVSGLSINLTAALTSALATAGEGGVSVPLQVATATTLGLLTTSPLNRVELWSSTGERFVDANRAEIYGRLTEGTGVYTLSFFALNNSGVETAVNIGGTAVTAQIELNYRFDFARFPAEAVVASIARNVWQDPRTLATSKIYRERLIPSAVNTLPQLTRTPDVNGNVIIMVNGISYDTLTGAASDFTVSGRAITWVPAQAGFNIETTDIVIADYTSLE
jgi:hypothetical protein